MSRSVIMAAEEIINNDLKICEKTVNRWTVEFYIPLALEFFRNEQYTDFCACKNIIDRILDRPVENIDILPLKINIFQFLSHISDAEKLDESFERDQNKTPLESALLLLEMMTKEFSLPQHDCENVCTLLKEMIVGTFIKNGQFEKAKEALNQYFPKSVTTKRATFMSLIRQKKKAHEVIEQINCRSFKKEMLDFCQRLYSFTPPFLLQAAKNLVQRRLSEPDDTTFGVDEEDQPSSSCCPQINSVQLQLSKPLIFQKIRLKMAFCALAEGSCKITFDQLEQEVDTEAQEYEIGLQHTPDPVRGTNSRYSVPRLLGEPDSQPSSQCATFAEELVTEGGTKQPPQTVSNKNDPKDIPYPVTNKEVIIPTQKYLRSSTRVSRTSSSLAGCSAESNKDSSDSVRNKEVNDEDPHDRSNQSFSRMSDNSKDSSSESEDNLQEQSTQRPPASPSTCPLSKTVNPGDIEDCSISDSSSDSSPTVSSCPTVSICPTASQKNSTPLKVTHPFSKWKKMVKNATETKDTWSDEESEFNAAKNSRLHTSTISNSGTKKRKWTESETEKLKEGVKRFGAGNWNKIQSYYSFKDRTNVNLKDRWRTLKKLNLV